MLNHHPRLWLIAFVIITIWCIGITTGSICSYSINGIPSCCRGFSKNVYGDCVKNYCSNDCGYGECIGNNLCKCEDGSYTRYSCLNQVINACPQNCNNHGTCINGKCSCSSDYTGRDCSIPVKSKCYISIRRGLCLSKFVSGKSVPDMSKEECCAIFNTAWGLPCQKCSWAIIGRCGRGYRYRNGRCEDIDECSVPGICEKGRCTNRPGSFECLCPSDHKYNETSFSCELDNPCLLDANLCKPFGFCINDRNGQYHCKCRSSYQLSNDRKRCVKKNQYNVCNYYKNLCSPYGSCVPNGYSYRCECVNGYYVSSDGKSCKAEQSRGICDDGKISRNQCQGGYCINRGSSDYMCSCLPGYQKSNNGKYCRLVQQNPCDDGSISKNQCQGGACINRGNGDYECTCLSGYKPSSDRKYCEKVRQSRGPCDNGLISRNQCQGGACINNGYYDYECSCLSGYKSSTDRKTCNRINTNNDNGDDDGGPYCAIPEYRARCKGGSCHKDSEFGFQCKCLDGYKLAKDRRACYKVKKRQKPCDDGDISKNECKGGTCINKGYSDYECTCLSGFELTSDRKFCQKIQQRPKPCDDGSISNNQCKGGTCVNRGYNDYECICLSGYEELDNGKYCRKIEKREKICDDGTISKNQCKGGVCINRGYSDYECTCLSGYKLTSDRKYCKKVKIIGGPCENQSISKTRCKGGKCINKSQYDFECACLPGDYRSMDGRTCYKLLVTTKPCDDGKISRNQCKGGVCINRGYNDFECVCRSGYKLSDNRKFCEKVLATTRPCDDGKISRNQCKGGTCINRGYNDFECSCLSEYKLSDNRKFCEKVLATTRPCDDSKISRNQCKGGTCINRGYNDFECSCLSGYKLSDNRKFCEKDSSTDDSDNYYCKIPKYRSRCQGGSCHGDKIYGFQCVCLPGYLISRDKRACTKNTPRNSASLVRHNQQSANRMQYCDIPRYRRLCDPGQCKPNKQSGFECICPKVGYKTSEDRRSCIKDDRMLADDAGRSKRSLDTESIGRQSASCAVCKFGCNNRSYKIQCLCPQNFRLINATSFCISKQINPIVMNKQKCAHKSSSPQLHNATLYSIELLIKIPPFINLKYKKLDYHLTNLYKHVTLNPNQSEYNCEQLGSDGMIYQCNLKC